MWRKTSCATLALLGFQAAAVSAADSFQSSGPASACPGYHLTNSTKLDLSITPDNGTISINAQGLSTTAAQVTLGLAITADGTEKYTSNFDPCQSTAGAELCPASDGVASFNASVSIPEDLRGTLGLSENEDVRARLWVKAVKADPQQYMACVETVLRSDESTAGAGSSNSTSGANDDSSVNSTSDGNSSASGNGTDSADSTKDSGASSLQAAWTVAMLSITVWFL